MTDRSIWVALALVAAVGCAPKSKATPGTYPVTAPPAQEPEAKKAEAGAACRVAEMDSCEAELEAVAKCFHACVSAAQEEPGETPLAAFLAEHGSGVACEPLGIEGPCAKLVLSDGGEVAFEHEMASHDNYDDHDVMHIVYAFSAGTCSGKAEIGIELHIGQ